MPVPVPVLSVGTDAVSAAWNAASDPGGTVEPSDSTASVSAVVTVWVSVRSTSVNVSVPEVGSVGVRVPPGVLGAAGKCDRFAARW